MAYVSKYTGPEIDRRLTQGTYDDAVAAGFTGSKEQFDKLLAAYTPEEMEKLNNKQDKEDQALETENKTVVGAINYLNSNKQDKTDDRLATESKIVVDAINEVNTKIDTKQDKTDEGFSTEQKTVVGAVNELHLMIDSIDDGKQDAIDENLDTNNKNIVGAINEIHGELDLHVLDYNKHMDDFETFKSETNNTLNTHSTSINQLSQEKQDKTDFNLETESKSITGAINEVNKAVLDEIARATAEDTRLEDVKVSYTNISDSLNPDRKTIMLKNHDSISGFGTDGKTAYNIAMVSKWDKVDLGAAGIPINLNGSEDHPTYNDSEKLAFVSELTGETSKLEEDIKTLNETVATVNQNLSASIVTLNQNVADGFNTINGGINNEIRPAIEKNTKDIGVVNDTLTTKINETEERLQTDINYLKPRVATLETLQIVKVDPDNEVYAASYELQDSTGKVYGQRINIATDKFIKSVSYENQILTIVFVLENGSEYSQNINISDVTNIYTAGGGITITENGVISVSDETLQMIQYSDSEVRRLEKDKIPYAYDEKTQSNINVILPEGGSYLGNYGDENATIAKAAVYDGIKQLEIGSSKVHTNINTDSDVTIETSTGKKTIATTDELVNVVNIPIRSLKDKVYTQEEIFDWFGVTSVPELKQKISRGSQMYLRYGILLSGNPMYYKMPIEYTAFESANQIKLVCVGLNTRDDVTSKYEIIINLDGTIIEGNSNVKLTLLSLEPDLSQYALKSEIPDISNLATKDEIPSLDGYVTETALDEKGYLTSIPEEYITETELEDKNYALKSELPDTSGFATTEALDTKADKTELENVVKYTDISDADDTPRKTIMLDNNDTLSAYNTAGTANNIAMVSKWDVVDLGSTGLPINLNGSKERPTYNDGEELALVSDLTAYQPITDNSLATSAKTIPAAINEIKESVDSISEPYEINLTNLLSAEDSKSISTAIGGIDNLNATVQDNRIIVGTISNGSVSVSIRILGNVTTLYYLLDSVVGLTLNEVKITNTSGTLSKSVTTHSVLTENMVINSLNSDETTLPLSAAQGKALDNKISSIDVSQDITNAINALDSSGQTASTGEVISSVSQENGVISVSKKTLTSDDIPELPQSKITDLETTLAGKQDAGDYATNTALTEGLAGKQDTISFNTAYNASNNKAATMQDVTSAVADKVSDIDEVGKTFVRCSDTEGKISWEALAGTNGISVEQVNTDSPEVDINYVSISLNPDNTSSNSLTTTVKTLTGAINEVLSKATGVGKVDPSSNGTGEIFNDYTNNKAIGNYAHAEGWLTKASGLAAHAEGFITIASGNNAHAEGNNTEASGSYAHAEGSNTTASGSYAHAEGYNTEASGSYAHAEGVYNFVDSSAIHMVGIGTSDTDRKNAHEIKNNGDHYVYGVGGFDGTNSDTAQSLQEVINSKQATVIDVSTLFADSATITSELSSQIAAYGESTATDFPLMYAGASIGNIKPTWIRTSAGITNFMCIADNKIWYFEIQGTTVQRASLAIS